MEDAADGNRPEDANVREALTCERAADEGWPARYLAGRHSPADEQAFELHLLGCPRCEEELRLAAAVRGALAGRPAVAVDAPSTSSPPRPHRWTRRAAPLVGLALAAVLAGVFLLRRGPPEKLARLGEVDEAPVYLGVPVRADPARGDSLFDAAMAAYAAGRWREASDGLEAALAAGVDPAPAAFFKGAALLMLDRPRPAAAAFARSAVAGDTPYRDEARLYRAKALLRLGQADAARAELRRVRRPPTDELGGWAAALADSVEAVTRSP
jgi:tetratricopeptide (TPR) repeat protein